MQRNVANTVTTSLRPTTQSPDGSHDQNALVAELSAVELGGPDESSKSQSPKSQSRKCVLLALVGLLVVIITVGGVCGSGVCSGGSSEQEALVPTMAPTSQKHVKHQMAILDFFGEGYFDGMNADSSQYQALDWITNDRIAPEDGHFIQRFVLAVFYFRLSQESRWVDCDPQNGSTCKKKRDGLVWMLGTNECSWGGIDCDDISGHVTELSMIQNDLNGELPTELAVLSKLTVLNLMDNRLTGPLPSELCTLASLEELNLSGNSLSGEISTEIGLLTSLSKMDLSNNQFLGSLPEEISALTGLYQFDIHGNFALHGKIPQAVCDSANSHNETEEITVRADCSIRKALDSNVTCPNHCCTECCYKGRCHPPY
ncbi:receptor-like protein kinase [Seminavis robusta]|uniref:Receptor-like protein kinase n=1 Tax=Seminavis robusta TaxID=568900 RepID=A0A9N8DK43_9STRA|nr:receptor-like protein kinase [Seminavis robusta]|eukprot:Sro187_g081050.1 receptor-like protein kinase (371) ;mRNA; r:84226-85338